MSTKSDTKDGMHLYDYDCTCVDCRHSWTGVFAPPRASWSFQQPATAAITPALQPTYFYRSDTIRRWERFGYSTEDARTLIEYLNQRT
jgi:hypothetical protein